MLKQHLSFPPFPGSTSLLCFRILYPRPQVLFGGGGEGGGWCYGQFITVPFCCSFLLPFSLCSGVGSSQAAEESLLQCLELLLLFLWAAPGLCCSPPLPTSGQRHPVYPQMPERLIYKTSKGFIEWGEMVCPVYFRIIGGYVIMDQFK